MQPRVLHILDHSIPLHSGYTFRTAAILREQRRLGWETFHLTSPKQVGSTADVELVDGLKFYRTNGFEPSAHRWPGFNERALMARLEARLLEVAAEVKPNVIHAHSPVLNAIPALRAGKKLGIPVVYEVRAFWEDAAVDHGTTSEGSLRYRLTKYLETRALRRADHVFTICEGLRSDMMQRGIPEQKITVIPNAVDIEAFNVGGKADQALKSSLGLDGCVVLGFIGSFYAYEGLDLLLAALPEMLQARPDVRLLLVGGGSEDAALKAQAKSLGVQDKVIFTGRVPHNEVGRYYDLVDVLVYPRHSMRLTELVTPLKPLEAMAQGRLMVASNVGGHRELIRDGKTGVLFQSGSAASLSSAVQKLLAMPERWAEFRAAGRHFVEDQRNWRVSVSNYREPYHALLKAKD